MTVCTTLTVVTAVVPVVWLSDYGFAKYNITTKVVEYIGDASCNVDSKALDNTYHAIRYTIEVTGAPVKSFKVQFKWTKPGETVPLISDKLHVNTAVGIHVNQDLITGVIYVSGTYKITEAALLDIVAA